MTVGGRPGTAPARGVGAFSSGWRGAARELGARGRCRRDDPGGEGGRGKREGEGRGEGEGAARGEAAHRARAGARVAAGGEAPRAGLGRAGSPRRTRCGCGAGCDGSLGPRGLVPSGSWCAGSPPSEPPPPGLKRDRPSPTPRVREGAAVARTIERPAHRE